MPYEKLILSYKRVAIWLDKISIRPNNLDFLHKRMIKQELGEFCIWRHIRRFWNHNMQIHPPIVGY